MADTTVEKGECYFGPPREPTIPPSECHAALSLVEIMFENILLHGDVPEEVLEWTLRVSEESKKLRSTLRIDSAGKDEDDDAVGDAIMTALLPTFHYKSSQELAGAALVSLIAAGHKHGWMCELEELEEKAPTPTAKRDPVESK
jgi:hypothetical protein